MPTGRAKTTMIFPAASSGPHCLTRTGIRGSFFPLAFADQIHYGVDMATITLKNIPPTLHGVLRQRAVLHHRSLNGEAISCLEAVLLPMRHDPADQIQRIRANRARITVPLDDRLLHQARHEGRP